MSDDRPITIKIDILHEKVKDLLKRGVSDEAIIKDLESEGIDPAYAQIIIDNVFNDIHDRKGFWKLMFLGVLMILLGVILNYLSYLISQQHRSSYFSLFWGIIIAGILMIVRAVIIYRK